MRTIFKIFGRSPFSGLQTHMDKVAACVDTVAKMLDLLLKGDYEKIEKLAKKVSKLEHDADLTKNNIRNELPRAMFLPVDRGNLLEILSLQDSIADQSEDIGVLLTLTKLEMIEEFREDFKAFLDKNIESFHVARDIIQQFDCLLESSFGKKEAEKISSMVDDVAYKEHEADILQRKLLKNLFDNEKEIPYRSFILWLQVFKTVASISNTSEKIGHRVRMTLEPK